MDKAKLVHIKFLDHSQCDGDAATPIECEVVGFLYRETRLAYYVATWICAGDINNPDTDVYVIVKHKGIKLQVIK